MRERRIAGAKVVCAQADAELAKLQQHRQRRLVPLHQDVLGQLQRDVLRPQLRLDQRTADAADEPQMREVLA